MLCTLGRLSTTKQLYREHPFAQQDYDVLIHRWGLLPGIVDRRAVPRSLC